MFIQSYEMPKMKNGARATVSRRVGPQMKKSAKMSTAMTICSGLKPMNSAVTTSHSARAPAHHSDSFRRGACVFIFSC